MKMAINNLKLIFFFSKFAEGRSSREAALSLILDKEEKSTLTMHAPPMDMDMDSNSETM